MAFVLRKTYAAGNQERYVAIIPGFENYPNPSAARYEPDIADATRFDTRKQAGYWLAVLTGPGGQIEVIQV